MLQVSSPWTRTLCLGTASRSSSPTARRRALMVRVRFHRCVHRSTFSVLSTSSALPLLGSLSEDAPPPTRGMAMGQAHAYSSRHANPMALARSLPVSVPVWGCRGNRSAQGEGNSGERVSTSQSVRAAGLHAEIKMFCSLFAHGEINGLTSFLWV